jgi:DNA-binding CsgD family transcriptional regulator
MEPDAAAHGLRERDHELAALDGALRRSLSGDAQVVVLVGPGGIGKSQLLGVARDAALGAGMSVLSARGSELESGFSFGIVRQLFEPLLYQAPEDARDRWLSGAARMAGRLLAGSHAEREADEDRFSRMHALYWLCANVASDRPLALLLDDAHWADETSLEFIGFLVRRLAFLPMLVVIGTRPPERSTPSALTPLLADPTAGVLQLAPLSLDAIAGWVQGALGAAPEPAFAHACHEMTGGNPLLMRELLREIEAEQLTPTASHAPRVQALAPRGVATIVLLRLGRLGPDAASMAQAVAILGDDARLRDAGQIAGLDEQTAMATARALEAVEIIEGGTDGVRFVHPVLRAAVLGDCPALRLSELHAAAARVRATAGAPVEEVASHLIGAQPDGEAWVVEALQAAARRAAALGDPHTAATYLRRALSEPPRPGDVPAVLAALGSAEASIGSDPAEEHMRAAITGPSDAPLRITTSLELANLLKFSARPAAAIDVLREAQTIEFDDTALRERLTVETLGIAFTSVAGYEHVRGELERLTDAGRPPRTFLEAFTLAALAFLDVCERAPYTRVAERAKRAFDGGLIPADPTRGGQAFIVATVALIWADEFEFVERLYADAREEARQRGSALTAASTASMSTMAGYKRGALLDAEENAQIGRQLAGEIVGAHLLSPVIGAYGVMIGLERGTSEADLVQLIADPAISHDMDNLTYSQVLPARGMLRERMHDLDGALADYLSCDRPQQVWGGQNPTMIPWRGRAALVLQRQGDTSEARRLADAEVQLAREYGAPRPLGIALHNSALVREGADRLELLDEAVSVLSGSSAAMDFAEAQVNLGAALRVAGDRTRARDSLRDGLELATRCGAVRIARNAREELATLGVRPRRDARSGAAALTPAERRVSELAIDGLSNRDIAQALFVTEKTVETHLGHTYNKLGIRSRHKLREVLRAPMLT